MNPVGVVRNDCSDPAQAMQMQKAESIIEVDKAFSDALYMIDSCEYLDVVFHFHLPESKAGEETGADAEAESGSETETGEETEAETGKEARAEAEAEAGAETGPEAEATGRWRRTTRSGEVRGVFASRAPARPNRIGITTVRLVSRDGLRLYVTGLDAVNGTPVLDIKSCNTSHLDDAPCGASNHIHTSLLKSNPRLAIQKHIMAGDTEKLMILAAQIHGHYCPGLAMGVMAAVHAMHQLDNDKAYPDNLTDDDSQTETESQTASGPVSDGLEDLLAIVETNNCFADGVQLVTGCSFGNNSLIFHDLGKTAFTLARRDGHGVRVISRPESQNLIREAFPDFDKHYKRVVKEQIRDEAEITAYKKSGIERSFGTLALDFDRLFDTRMIAVSIPDYAPSHDSEICAQCGESVMATRTIYATAANTSASPKKPGTIEITDTSGSSGKPGNSESAPDEKLCLKCAGKSYAVLDGFGIHKPND